MQRFFKFLFILFLSAVLPQSIFSKETIKLAKIEGNALYEENIFHQSYLQHICDIIQRYTGFSIEFIPLNEGESVSALKNGIVDVVPFMHIEEGNDFFYTDIPSAIGHIVVASDRNIAEITSAGSTRNPDVFSYAESLSNAAIIPYSKRQDIYRDLWERKIDAFVECDLIIPHFYKTIEVLEPYYYHLAVRKTDRSLFKAINTSFSLSSELEASKGLSTKKMIAPQIKENWLTFTPIEKSYILKRKILKVAILDNIPPISYSSVNSLKGICIDSFKIIEQITGFNIEPEIVKSYEEAWTLLEQQKVDAIFAGIALKPKTKESYTLTIPYIHSTVMAVGTKAPQKTEKGPSEIYLPEIYRFFEPMIRSMNPFAVNIKYCKEMSECIDNIMNNPDSVTYMSDYESMYYENLYSSGTFTIVPTGTPIPLSLIIKKDSESPILLSILDKSIASIAQHENERNFLKYVEENNEFSITRFTARHPKKAIIIIIIIVLLISSTIFIAAFNHLRNRKNKQIINFMNKANRDSMTGLFNRAAYKSFVEEILSHHTGKERENMALIMIDIDKFKTINDTLGHSTGDEVIITVAKTLQHFFKQSDLVCRMGGDEFSVFLLNFINKELLNLRMQELIKEFALVFPKEKYSVPVSCSIGISIAKEGNNFDYLYNQADSALYKVKESGRNSFSFAE
ncbi:diguanylate cyclase domain-containing protein, partial [Treponema sp.]|uniref:diguanylate cyclase domain-containing protein n=1 Tax=Treponema sp. TaxID=166 RepID=UPI00388F4D6A